MDATISGFKKGNIHQPWVAATWKIPLGALVAEQKRRLKLAEASAAMRFALIQRVQI